MQHYYTDNTNLESEEKVIESYINNKKYKFFTDIGVFSKSDVDFGTKTLLENFSTDKKNANLCDLGCGYGVVTIFLSNMYNNFNYTMIDVNKRALNLAKKNIELNNIKSSIEIFENNSLDNIEKIFDIVITNPPIRAGKKIVHKMIEQSYNNLSLNGELWVVIQKKQGMDSTKKLMNDLFSNVEIIVRNKGYYVLKAIKY